jgi:predicted transcriptional regulator
LQIKAEEDARRDAQDNIRKRHLEEERDREQARRELNRKLQAEIDNEINSAIRAQKEADSLITTRTKQSKSENATINRVQKRTKTLIEKGQGDKAENEIWKAMNNNTSPTVQAFLMNQLRLITESR